MLHALIGKIRNGVGFGFYATVKRAALVLTFTLLVAAYASAYTIVMRDGRRLEIPDSFTVTPHTLTYEHAPGIQITLQMTSIDIAATEAANNEPLGSLLKRTPQQQPTTRQQARLSSKSARAARTITSQDLEASRRARLSSEAAYERRRVELGLPSLEDSRRRTQEEAERAGELLRQSEDDEVQAEAYWRARATELRNQIVVTSAEISYLRARLSELPDNTSTVSFANLSSFPYAAFTIGGIPRPSIINRPVINRPGINHPTLLGTTRPGAQLTGRMDFGGGASRGQLLINTPSTIGNLDRRTVFGRGLIFAPQPFYTAAPPSYFNFSYERAALVTRLHEVEATRAGLEARWRLLEDEARRAGAPPGWLRL
jgi:hypothetical protein